MRGEQSSVLIKGHSQWHQSVGWWNESWNGSHSILVCVLSLTSSVNLGKSFELSGHHSTSLKWSLGKMTFMAWIPWVWIPRICAFTIGWEVWEDCWRLRRELEGETGTQLQVPTGGVHSWVTAPEAGQNRRQPCKCCSWPEADQVAGEVYTPVALGCPHFSWM